MGFLNTRMGIDRVPLGSCVFGFSSFVKVNGTSSDVVGDETGAPLFKAMVLFFFEMSTGMAART